MTIAEAVEQGIARITRDPWSWTSFIELYLSEERGKKFHGPLVKVATMGLDEVATFAVWEFPNDDEWRPWEVPAEMKDFYERELAAEWAAPLWGRDAKS